MSKDKKVTQPHDMFFKKTFGRKEVMLDFLKYNLPEGIFKKVDQQSLRLTNKSFVHPVGIRGESDLVFQAQIENKQGYIYFLVEHQSKTDDCMPLRFMEYNAKLMRQHVAENKGSKLPLILNICVYNGKVKYVGDTNLLSMFDSPELAQEYMFNDFYLIDLHTSSDNSLAQQKKAALGSMILKYGASRDFSTVLQNNKIFILALHNEENDPSYVEDAYFYILMVDKNEDILEVLKSFDPKLKELAMSAAEKLRMEGEQIGIQKGEQIGIQKGEQIGIQKGEQIGIQKGEQIGIQKGEQIGIQKGKVEGKIEVAKSLLKSGISLEIIASSTGLSIDKIKHLTHSME